MAQKEAERVQMIGNLDDWVAVFAENAIFDEDKSIDTLVQPETVICRDVMPELRFRNSRS